MRQHVRILTAGLAAATSLVLGATAVQGALEDYVKGNDPSVSWRQIDNHQTEAGTITRLDLTSQTWRDIVWKHDLRIYEPTQVTFPDAMLLFITGGSTGRSARDEDHAQAFALAQLCGARVAVLPQVPNQPLLEDRYEDDLISETFVHYLETGDETWPLLLPMVKSAVSAMDAIQEWAQQKGQPVERFVVTGASKRGWTTWLTGAVDDRVLAIAPMVIPTLKMKEQCDYQLETWGKYSEQIDDYVRRGLMDKFDTPEGKSLLSIVDPYAYLDRITQPVLQINGTNDRYWTLDSMNLYWDEIRGPKWVVYLPNAGHGLDQNRAYALHGIGAFFRHVVSGRPMPELSWNHDDIDDGALRLTVHTKPEAKRIRFWVARSETKDFREAEWRVEDESGPAATSRFQVDRPERGSIALFGDIAYEIDGIEYHLSTQIRQVNPEPEE